MSNQFHFKRSCQLLHRSLLLLVGMAIVLSITTQPGHAAQSQPELNVQIGVAGTYMIGCWTEVRVQTTGVPDQLHLVQVSVLDADGNIVQYRSVPNKADSTGKISANVPVHIGRVNTRFTVSLFEVAGSAAQNTNENKLLREIRIPIEQTTELTQFQPLYVAVGKVEGISVTTEFVDKLHVQSIDNLSELPKNPLCWQGIDTLLYETKQLSGSQAQGLIDRLTQWVQQGGHLVVFPGSDPEDFMKSRLAQSLPVTFDGIAQVRDFSRLESFVGEPTRIRNRTAVSIPLAKEFDGKIIVNGLSGPLIIRCPWGLGRVTVVGVNLNERFLQQWDALPQLYRLLAELPETGEKKSVANSKLLTKAGLTDFKTQWDAALSDFQIQTPSVWLPLGCLLLAALLVGPFDYFLVKHVLKRPWLTWITFPSLIVLLVAWGILGIDPRYSSITEAEGKQVNNSKAVIANQCMVIDYAADTNFVRHAGYVKLFCNETGRYNIESEVRIPFGNANSAGLFAPGAVPEQSFRGYYRESGIHLDQTNYQVEPSRLKSLSTPIYESSTALFEITGSNRVTASELAKENNQPVIDHQLVSSNTNHLKGTLTHHLDNSITDWILVYGKIVYFVDEDHPLAELDPAEPLRLPSRSITQKEFTSFITGTTKEVVEHKKGPGEDLMVQRKDYDPFSTNLTSILRTVSFHETIGGKEYTSLTNIELNTWDFTPLLKLNRAILIGRLKDSTIETTVNGQSVKMLKNNCYIRLVIPVEQNLETLDRLPNYNKID